MATGRKIKGITIEIGGDTTNLQSALKGVNSVIRDTQAQLKDVDKLLKLDPGNIDLITQKQRILSDAIGATKEKLETLREAADQAKVALENGEINQSQYEVLQREIFETENKLKSLEEQAAKSTTAMQKLADTGKKFKDTGEKIENAGKKLMPATVAVAGIGAASVKTAATFESSMSQVQATMGITKDSLSEVNGESVNTMKVLSDLAKQMGSETAFSASECAQAINYLALAGYDTQQMIDTLPIVLDLAAAGNMDLARASDMVTDAMSALGMETSQSKVMVDQMAITSSKTNTSVEQLGEGILSIGASARTIKGGTAELNTALGILANNGIKGAEGGIHLRNVILSLQTATGSAKTYLDELGVSVYDSDGKMRDLNSILGELNASMESMTDAEKADIINTIFNKTDLAAVNALLDNTGKSWEDLQNTIIESSGAAGEMADTQLDNMEGQLTKLKSAIEFLAISIGESLMPVIKIIIDKIQEFVNWFNALDEGTKDLIVKVGLVVAAVAPILLIIGKILSAVGTIITFVPKIMGVIKTIVAGLKVLWGVLMANPISLIIGAIAALVAGFVYLWNNCEEFRQFWIDLWEKIKEVAIVCWEYISNFFTEMWTTIKETAVSLWNSLKEFFGSLWESIKSVFTTVVSGISSFLSTTWDTIKNTVVSVWNSIKTFFVDLFNSISNIFSSIWNSIKETISSIIQNIKDTAINVFTSMWDGIKNVVGNIKDSIVEGFNTAVDFIKNLASSAYEWGKDIIMGIVDGIKGCIHWIGDACKSVADKIRSFLHFSVPDEGPLTDYESWMPDFMKGLARGIEKSRGLIQGAMEDVSSDMILNPKIDAVHQITSDSISYRRNSNNNTAAIIDAIKSVAMPKEDIVVPVYIGGTLFDEAVITAQARANLKSGGR